MRPIALLSLTVATQLALLLLGCAGSRQNTRDTASSQPATTSPGPATTVALPPSAPVASSASTSPSSAPASPTTSGPVVSSSPPASPVLAGAPACPAGCDSPSLAPKVQQTCRVQCARLAQQSPPGLRLQTATPQPDLEHQRAQCQSQCDAEIAARQKASKKNFWDLSHDWSTCTTYCERLGFEIIKQPAVAACEATCDSETSLIDRANCRSNCHPVGTDLNPAVPPRFRGW